MFGFTFLGMAMFNKYVKWESFNAAFITLFTTACGDQIQDVLLGVVNEGVIG